MRQYLSHCHRLLLVGLLLVASVLACWRAWPVHAQEAQGTPAAPEKPEIIAPTDKDTCVNCHADVIDIKHFTGSAHGAVNCQTCHRGVDRYPHPKEAIAKKPVCASCHTRNATSLTHSVHGVTQTSGKALPNCQSCHGKNAHEIVKPETLTRQQQEASCRSCHQDKAASLAASIHGQNAATAGGERPGCLSCHGGNPHAIKPPVKTPSPQQNIPCQQCHAADTARMLNSAHGKAMQGDTKKPLSCLSCHGQDHDPHTIGAARQLTAADKNALCEKCHADKAKLLRASAHGNVDMQSGQRPTCITCHGSSLHDVTLTSRMTPSHVDAPCKSCHTEVAQDLAKSVHTHGMTKSGQKFEGCLSCHGGGNPHAVATVSTLTRRQQEAPCLSCHRDLSTHLADSVHNRPDKKPGDHPTCLTCHGGSPHKISPPKHLTPIQKVQLCARCHADKERMARYGRTDAVEAYAQTFHGRAILLFHQTKEATCTDCHGIHGILSPSDPRAPTTPQHAAMICGKCHQGNKMDFAYSYASHLRLNVEKSIVTPLEERILYVLVFIPYLWFAVLIVLGISHVYCRRHNPAAAERLENTFNILGLLTLLVAIVAVLTLLFMRRLTEPVPHWSLVSSIALLAITGVALLFRRIIFRCPVK